MASISVPMAERGGGAGEDQRTVFQRFVAIFFPCIT